MVLVHKKKSKTKFGVARSRNTTLSSGRGRGISKSKRMKRFIIKLKKEWFDGETRELTACIENFIFNYARLTPYVGSFESIVYNINEKTKIGRAHV